MTYAWRKEQRARVVPGCTLVHVGKYGDRLRVEVLTARFIDGGLWIDMAGDLGDDWECRYDASTLRSPTLSWLRVMARKKLGRGFRVIACRNGSTREPVVTVVQGDVCRGTFTALPTMDERSSCAVWLAALPEVQP